MRRLLSLVAALLVLSVIVPVAWADPPDGKPPDNWVAKHPIRVHSGPMKAPSGGRPGVSGPYNPSQIRSAYGIDMLNATGTGQTIAIVDACGSPTIEGDVATFNTTWGLPHFGQSGPKLTVYYQGGESSTCSDSGWAIETALDVEWAHALAPDANILLVVAKTAYYSDMMAAVDYAKSQPGIGTVSMSWGGPEWSGQLLEDGHFTQPGVVFAAASGDDGTQIWPAASPNVVAVGGTTLTLDTSANVISEKAWLGSGGGISTYESEPSYQISYPAMLSTGGKRGVPDVAFDADPKTGVYVYSGGGWWQVGGTSFGTPCWAALIALADQLRGSPLTGGNAALYRLADTAYAGNYRDIVSGRNTKFRATSGYDFVTGLGSPKANNLVPALAGWSQ